MKPVRAKQIRGKILALAIGERSLFAAEVHADGQHVEARQLAEFIYPPGLSLDSPDALGKALGPFLRQHHFHAHATVLGLPAKWLMVRNEQVPPAADSVIADLLRLQSEQEFSSEMDLMFDYASDRSESAGDQLVPDAARNTPSPALPLSPAATPNSSMSSGTETASSPAARMAPGDGSRSVLLMATPRRQVDAVLKMAQAADLNVQSITSSSAALASVTLSRQPADIDRRLGSRLVLYLDRSAAELTMQRGSVPAMLKHLRFERGAAAGGQSDAPAANASAATTADDASPSLAWLSPPANGGPRGDAFSNFVGELRRAVALLPRDSTGLTHAAASQREMALWDSSGLSADELRRLQEAVGFPVRGEGLASIGVVTANGAAAAGDRYGAAVALAISALQGDLPVDFLHSRLAPAKKSRYGTVKLWSAISAAVILVLIVALYFYAHALQNDADNNRTQLDALQPRLKAAKQLQDKVEHAGNWFSGRTPITACLTDLTRLYPDSDQSWATQFEMQRNNESQAFGCKLVGKTSRQSPLALPDSLDQDPHFSQVYISTSEQSQDVRETRSALQENFELTFIYDDQPSPGHHSDAAKLTMPAPARTASVSTVGNRAVTARSSTGDRPSSAAAPAPVVPADRRPTTTPAIAPAAEKSRTRKD